MLTCIERAGRNCYKSEDKITDESAKAFVAMLIKRGHEAMLEHAPNIGTLFHVPRGLTHEFVRHRLASFGQESTRYCNYSKGKFGTELTLIPMMDGLTSVQIERRKDLWEAIERVYLAEIDEGIKPQQARDNLPICLKSDIVITTNVRHWREIFRQRTTKFAHPQMQTVMKKLLADFRSRVSVLFDDVGTVD
ncbi:MAG: FAD-dependent thymidylate synthase [Candidatus Thorarchaeota archaeon]